MNIVLLGSGGREHAFAYAISQSNYFQYSNSKLWTAPGNPGIAQCGINLPHIGVSDFAAIEGFVRKNDIKMIVVGPEDPLVNGIYDYFQKTDLVDVTVIGPSQAGAMLEGSKLTAKLFMRRHRIPTADFRVYSLEGQQATIGTLGAGIKYINKTEPPFVIKADGLAAGKGVTIAQTREDAVLAFTQMLENKKFGESSSKVLVEDFLDGTEFSVFVVTDGNSYKILPVAKDYKRVGHGDTGLNTGGMGAISFDKLISDELMKKVEEKIVQPTIAGLHADGITYKGFLYIGCMSVNGEPYVVEYNCRMGDPETQVVFPRIKSDFLEMLLAIQEKTLDQYQLEIDPRVCVAVVAVSNGYPELFSKGHEVDLPRIGVSSEIFHAGTRIEDGVLVTSGGRVLAVTAINPTITGAVAEALMLVAEVHFANKYFRRDIGHEFMLEQVR